MYFPTRWEGPDTGAWKSKYYVIKHNSFYLKRLKYFSKNDKLSVFLATSRI